MFVFLKLRIVYQVIPFLPKCQNCQNRCILTTSYSQTDWEFKENVFTSLPMQSACTSLRCKCIKKIAVYKNLLLICSCVNNLKLSSLWCVRVCLWQVKFMLIFAHIYWHSKYMHIHIALLKRIWLTTHVFVCHLHESIFQIHLHSLQFYFFSFFEKKN